MSQPANPAAPNTAPLTPDHRPCEKCGAQILKIAEICPKCGVRQRSPVSKTALLLLTFFFGGIGAHKFYLGKYWQGALYLIFCWTMIPTLIALVEFFIYVFTDSERLNEKYSAHGSAVIVLVAVGVFGFFMIGILAAIAIPAYTDYQTRARVSAVIISAMPWRIAVQEHYAEQRKLPNGVAELRKESVPSEAGNNYSSMSVGPNGVITATLSPTAGAHRGKTLEFRASETQGGGLSWDCTGGTLEPRYRPANCRPQR
jgi:TM2 domain-containing membrane protein YozV/Tfp pilus assembly protein PilE